MIKRCKKTSSGLHSSEVKAESVTVLQFQLAAEMALLFAEKRGTQPLQGLARCCVLPAWAEAKLLATIATEVKARLARRCLLVTSIHVNLSDMLRMYTNKTFHASMLCKASNSYDLQDSLYLGALAYS